MEDTANNGCRLCDEAVSKWQTVDVLVNNAGITKDSLVMRMKPEAWQAVIDTNLTGVFYATQVSNKSISPYSFPDFGPALRL